MKNNMALRGEVWTVRLDPSVGSEINKTRAALIISNDMHNRLMGHVTVLPLTEFGNKIFTVEVFLPKGTAGLVKDSKIKCQQIRAVDKSRLIKFLGHIDKQTFVLIKEAIRLHLGFY